MGACGEGVGCSFELMTATQTTALTPDALTPTRQFSRNCFSVDNLFGFGSADREAQKLRSLAQAEKMRADRLTEEAKALREMLAEAEQHQRRLAATSLQLGTRLRRSETAADSASHSGAAPADAGAEEAAVDGAVSEVDAHERGGPDASQSEPTAPELTPVLQPHGPESAEELAAAHEAAVALVQAELEEERAARAAAEAELAAVQRRLESWWSGSAAELAPAESEASPFTMPPPKPAAAGTTRADAATQAEASAPPAPAPPAPPPFRLPATAETMRAEAATLVEAWDAPAPAAAAASTATTDPAAAAHPTKAAAPAESPLLRSLSSLFGGGKDKARQAAVASAAPASDAAAMASSSDPEQPEADGIASIAEAMEVCVSGGSHLRANTTTATATVAAPAPGTAKPIAAAPSATDAVTDGSEADAGAELSVAARVQDLQRRFSSETPTVPPCFAVGGVGGVGGSSSSLAVLSSPSTVATENALVVAASVSSAGGGTAAADGGRSVASLRAELDEARTALATTEGSIRPAVAAMHKLQTDLGNERAARVLAEQTVLRLQMQLSDEWLVVGEAAEAQRAAIDAQRAANEAQRARVQLERALAAAAEARAAEARAEEARAAGGVYTGLTVRVPPSPTLSQAAGSAPAASPFTSHSVSPATSPARSGSFRALALLGRRKSSPRSSPRSTRSLPGGKRDAAAKVG